jgi:hypothetical protein
MLIRVFAVLSFPPSLPPRFFSLFLPPSLSLSSLSGFGNAGLVERLWKSYILFNFWNSLRRADVISPLKVW